MNEIQVYEEQIISTLVKHPDLIAEVTDLQAEHFAGAGTRAMFESFMDVSLSGMTPDVINVAEGLESRNVPHQDLYTICEQSLGNAKNLTAYAKIVRDGFEKRRELFAAERFQQQVMRGEKSALTNLLSSLESSSPSDHYISLADSLRDTLEHADNLYTGKVEPGIPTGVKRLDEVTGGFHASDLIIMAGRPAMGKTAVMMNMILNSGMPAMVMSAEQGSMQLTQRNIAMTGRIDLTKFRTGRFDQDDFPRMADAVTELDRKPVHYYAPPTLTLDDLCRQAVQAKARHNIKLIAVDYIQIIDVPAGENRNLAVGSITRRLKGLAKQLDVCILALSQLNRECEKRNNKRPMMSDLKESGSIEQDADSIWSLYREGVYTESVQDRVLEIGILKNRHGPIGKAYAGWLPEFVALDDLHPQELSTYRDAMRSRYS